MTFDENNLLPGWKRLLQIIGVGRFRILGGGGGRGGQGLEFWGARGGQIPSRHMTS